MVNGCWDLTQLTSHCVTGVTQDCELPYCKDTTHQQKMHKFCLDNDPTSNLSLERSGVVKILALVEPVYLVTAHTE